MCAPEAALSGKEGAKIVRVVDYRLVIFEMKRVTCGEGESGEVDCFAIAQSQIAEVLVFGMMIAGGGLDDDFGRR